MSGDISGLATDINGNPVIDPTKNVLDLVESAIKRQDDLRNMESQHTKELMNLRADHYKELRILEAERINAIRAVDVAAVQSAANVSATQATTLAAQVAQSAETLRNQVAAAATASTVALGAALDPIQKDIADLRKTQYEQAGQRVQVSENRQTGIDGRSAMFAFAGLLISIAILISRFIK